MYVKKNWMFALVVAARDAIDFPVTIASEDIKWMPRQSSSFQHRFYVFPLNPSMLFIPQDVADDSLLHPYEGL
jgi:hypothetical protein